jgi:site-specific DNA-methyltransferase (adenine-specific)
MTDVAEGPGWVLHCGDYREVLADVTCDLLCADPPYSARTHEGHDSLQAYDASGPTSNKRRQEAGLPPNRRALGYDAWSAGDVDEAVAAWSRLSRGWVVVMCDSGLVSAYEAAYEAAGRYAFHPIPCCVSGMTVRMAGDGPSSWAVYAMASRPRSAEWLAARKAKRDARGEIKSLPGFYAGPREEQEHIGGKPLWLMRAIVRDYSEPGDVVCDPCAGGATTLLAAVIEGRTAIGAERDPETWEKAVRRLRRGYTAVFDFGGAR